MKGTKSTEIKAEVPSPVVPSVDVAESIIRSMKSRFDVQVETQSGNPAIVFRGIPAETKGQAINKAKSMLVFTAERSN